VVKRQLEEVQFVMSDLQQRDDNLYRVIFQADPIPLSVRRGSSANTEYYDQLLDMTNSEIVVSTTKKLNELKKEIYIQSKSYDELVMLSKNKETMLASLPAIQPISNKDLTRMASGFGWRIDPVYHTRRFHAGMDFTAPIGTDIYATANGTISAAGWQQGYGNCVQINHGYGYLTLYGHMSAIKVRVGQSVKRGEVIGLVGSTGKSTGPHCHYEVHYKGEIMNPQNYYFLDLSPADYDRMVQMSNNAGQTLD
jgi:murein DD-endopeptidase MepM/ murein hydrolase activator NlpD